MTSENIKRTVAYLVNLSRGEPVRIDQEELTKVLAALQAGAPVVVKQGIINPSYVVSVTPDMRRIDEYVEMAHKYKDEHTRTFGMKPLAELIDRAEVLASLQPAQRKMLGNKK